MEKIIVERNRRYFFPSITGLCVKDINKNEEVYKKFISYDAETLEEIKNATIELIKQLDWEVYIIENAELFKNLNPNVEKNKKEIIKLRNKFWEE